MADDRVIFEIRAENDQLKAKLAESQNEIEKLKAKGEDADQSGLGFKKSVSAVRSWIGSVTAAIGVATTFFVLGQKIRAVYDDLFTSGAEKGRNFANTVLSPDATDRVKAYSDEIDKLQTRLAQSLESPTALVLNTLQGFSTDSLKSQIAELEKSRSDAQEQLTAKRLRDEEAVAKKQQEEAVAAALEVQRQFGLDRARKAAERKAEGERLQQETDDLIEKLQDEMQDRLFEGAKRAAEEYVRIIREGMAEVTRAQQQAQQQQIAQSNGNLIALRRTLQIIANQMPAGPGNSGFVGGRQ